MRSRKEAGRMSQWLCALRQVCKCNPMWRRCKSSPLDSYLSSGETVWRIYQDGRIHCAINVSYLANWGLFAGNGRTFPRKCKWYVHKMIIVGGAEISPTACCVLGNGNLYSYICQFYPISMNDTLSLDEDTNVLPWSLSSDYSHPMIGTLATKCCNVVIHIVSRK